MKTCTIPESEATKLFQLIDEADAWDEYDVVVVRDEDYEQAVETAKQNLSEGKRIRSYRNGELDGN